MKLPFIKGSRVTNDAEFRDSLPINLVGTAQEIGEFTGYLRTADGIMQFATAVGPDRGGLWSDRFRTHVRLSGDTFVEIDEFGAVTSLSGLSIPGSNKAQFDNSFNSIAFVANGEYYRWDTATLTQIARPGGAQPFIDMCWIDGYYIFTDGENLWNTTLADETVFNPNERAGSDFAPDEILGVEKTTDNRLIVFNRYSTERFSNVAGASFPFARQPGAAIPIGITGTNAKVNIGDGRFVVFGGSKEYSPSFFVLSNSYQPISTKEIDTIIDTYSDFELATIQLEFRDVRDQRLVIAHLPLHTLVYDVTLSAKLGVNIWYQWTTPGQLSYRAINGVYDPRNIDNGASGWVYGDKLDNRIGKLEPSSATQYGQAIEFVCESPLIKARGTVRVLELVTAPGHASLPTDTVFLSTTKDGVLFGAEYPLPRGVQGNYQHRIIARRLGDYPNWFGVRVRGYSSGVFTLVGGEVNEIN